MGIPRDIWQNNPSLSNWSILIGYRGSIAHGTFIPTDDPTGIDDKDAMAFCVPPIEHYYGLSEFGSRGTQEIVQERDKTLWDIVIYETRKAISLLEKGNPNVLSMLWLPKNYYLHQSDAGNMLIENKDLFVGRHVYRSFVGYAVSQLRKMEGGVYKGYMGDKRRSLVKKFGYDTKNASHLIRLLRQGIEFLRDGELYVERHDAPELVAIKRGEWTLERVKREAERLFKRVEDVYDQSTLPIRPDRQKINDLCVEVVRLAIG